MMKTYRNEWKYSCTNDQLARIEERLKAVLQKDAHAGENGKYGVHSLYFDDMYNSCASDVEAGNGQRYKYRIRYYDGDTQFLRLERKEKLYGGCHKLSCRLTMEEYDALVTGQVSDLLYDTQKPLIRMFCADILKRRFTPREIVDYERTAYVEPITNIRITLDTNISVSAECDRFLTGDQMRVPLMRKDHHVLEVKFDSILPAYVKRCVSESGLQQQSFSKYNLGFELLRSIR